MTEPRVKFLRENATDPERLLWGQLRDKRVEGLRFRRQFPIGPYVVDFACLPARLGIEIDGPSHDLTAEADAHRTAWLESQNFSVLRFTNAMVMRRLEGVVRTFAQAIAQGANPSPYPPPASLSSGGPSARPGEGRGTQPEQPPRKRRVRRAASERGNAHRQ